MEKPKDYYVILGVARNASTAAIKRAFRRLAKKYHPDLSARATTEDFQFMRLDVALDKPDRTQIAVGEIIVQSRQRDRDDVSPFGGRDVQTGGTPMVSRADELCLFGMRRKTSGDDRQTLQTEGVSQVLQVRRQFRLWLERDDISLRTDGLVHPVRIRTAIRTSIDDRTTAQIAAEQKTQLVTLGSQAVSPETMQSVQTVKQPHGNSFRNHGQKQTIGANVDVVDFRKFEQSHF